MEGRVAFVVGASEGIGAEIAFRLAGLGYDLAVSARSVEHLADTVGRIGQVRHTSLPVALDMVDVRSIKTTFDSVLQHFGRIDVLVNSAAVRLKAPAVEVTPEQWDDVERVNLRGVFFLCQAMGRYLIEAGRPGCIINLGSTHGIVSVAGRSVYGITKAGVHHVTRALALEWADRQIRVNTVAPATVETSKRQHAHARPEYRKQMLGRLPMGRFGTPQDVAAAVCYLASDDASFITGQTLVLDGGLTLQ